MFYGIDIAGLCVILSFGKLFAFVLKLMNLFIAVYEKKRKTSLGVLKTIFSKTVTFLIHTVYLCCRYGSRFLAGEKGIL